MTQGRAPESRRARFFENNLQLRIASALVLGAVVLALAWMGGVPFRILSAAMAAAIFYEWGGMARGDTGRTPILMRTLLVVVLAVMIAGLPAPICFGLLAIAVLIALVFERGRHGGYWNAGGLAYAAVPALAAAFLRGGDDAGLKAMIFLFVVVWATDILAYFVGRSVGGPKLAPAISPGKTQSGALGGAVGGVVAGMCLCLAVGSRQPIAVMALVALLLSIVSQAGDLAESAMKRHFGVKDSGRLIPGHGGIMDRVDGLVAAAVLFYVVGAVISGWDAPAHGFFR
jgi:phosphatidate cytidylyltransferase